MASIKELDRQEEFNNWYYERLQQSVNKIVEKIPTDKDANEK
jgi:hypothetical protein